MHNPKISEPKFSFWDGKTVMNKLWLRGMVFLKECHLKFYKSQNLGRENDAHVTQIHINRLKKTQYILTHLWFYNYRIITFLFQIIFSHPQVCSTHWRAMQDRNLRENFFFVFKLRLFKMFYIQRAPLAAWLACPTRARCNRQTQQSQRASTRDTC